MNRWLNCWRYSVFTYVVFFCLTGVAELIATTYILLRRFSLRYFVNGLGISRYASYIAPVLVAASAFIGWNGVSRKHRRTIKMFSVLTSLTVCVEIAVCVWAFIEKEDLGRVTADLLKNKFEQNQNKNDSAWWDTLQTQGHCCGIHGPSDYKNSHQAIPFSCCDLINGPLCGQVYSKGCLFPLIDLLTSDFLTISLCFLITACCQLPGVFLSWALANRLDGINS